MDASLSLTGEQEHRTVWSEPPSGRSKFQETRHPLYRGVRRRGRAGQWVCEMRVHRTKGSRFSLGTFHTAEMAARVHDSAALALSGRDACLNFADSAWRMQPGPGAGPLRFRGSSASAQVVKDAVAAAVDQFQEEEQRHVASTAKEKESALSMSSGLLSEHDEEQWIGGIDEYYASLAQGMLVEPPDAGAWRVDGEHGDVETPLWSYL